MLGVKSKKKDSRVGCTSHIAKANETVNRIVNHGMFTHKGDWGLVLT